MHSDGVVREWDLLHSLTVLGGRMPGPRTAAPAANSSTSVSLSLGYYHEQPVDKLFDPMLSQADQAPRRPRAWSCWRAAGNDATCRPSYPAAFSPHPGGVAERAEPRRAFRSSARAR